MKSTRNNSLLADDEEDENFFVSFSDLMTGVLFVFVILTTAMALHYHLKEGELSTERDKATEAHREATIARADAERERQTATNAALAAADERAKAREANREATIARADAERERLMANNAALAAADERAKAGEARGKAMKAQEVIDAMAKVLKEREQRRKEELQSLVRQLKSKDLDVELDETNGILRLPERLLFKNGEAKVQAIGESALSILATEMLPIVLRGCNGGDLKWEAIYVEGHTDDVPIKTPEFPSNWELSSARAISISKALVLAAPLLGTLHNHQDKAILGISGYAHQRPVADNASEDGRRRNRRIDIRFVMAYPSKAEIEEMERKIDKASGDKTSKP